MKILLFFLFVILQTSDKVYVTFNITDDKQQKASAKVEIYHNHKLVHKTNGSFFAEIKKGNYTIIITRCKKDTIQYNADRDKETWVVVNTECEM